ARCSAIVARSSTTSDCRVAITDGITQQNVQRNPPGTLPRHDPVNGYLPIIPAWQFSYCIPINTTYGSNWQTMRNSYVNGTS
ncbi:MAG: hypothetical protein NTX54_01350, partial [Chloroflexi bacterium]|nr:hypothetical protein [Chloroflexota bacterium]